MGEREGVGVAAGITKAKENICYVAFLISLRSPIIDSIYEMLTLNLSKQTSKVGNIMMILISKFRKPMPQM